MRFRRSSNVVVGGTGAESREQPLVVSVSSDCNSKCRKSMEDQHVYALGFAGDPFCAYFGVFDGHAGPQCARECAKQLHVFLEKALEAKLPVPQAMHKAFNNMDKHLEGCGVQNSGSTAAIALLRYELNGEKATPTTPGAVRKLYVANAGDTRVVLCRGARALRLSYDHRGSDLYERQRVNNCGGIIMNNRVNGMLAVTRALGDLYMKHYVVGDPYTTDTILCDEDEYLIIACDGLWDVCTDEQALNLVRSQSSSTDASAALLSHALDSFSTDNLTIMVISLR